MLAPQQGQALDEVVRTGDGTHDLQSDPPACRPSQAPHTVRLMPMRIPQREDRDLNGQLLLDATLSLAQTQLIGQLADETSLDGRTMEHSGSNGALLASDIAAREILGAFWWLPLIVVGMATLFCLRPALGIGPGFEHDTDLGPGADMFYAAYGAQSSASSREQLLRDLGTAFANNARRLAAKQRALRSALVILAIGMTTSSLAIALDRPSTIHHGHENHQAARTTEA